MSLRTTLSDALADTSDDGTLLVVSDSHVGSSLAAELASRTDVHLLTDHDGVAGQAPDAVQVTVGDLRSPETLATATGATAAVVALRRDRAAVLVTQLLRTHLGLEDIVTVINDPQRHDAFDGLARTTVCGSSVLAAELRRTAESVLPTYEPQTE